MLARSCVIACALLATARADELSPPEAATAGGAREPYWLTYAAFRNDVFTELVPPIDDQGFTHDNVFTLRRRQGAYTVGGGFVHRWITSRQDRRRWDLLQLFVTGERIWLDSRTPAGTHTSFADAGTHGSFADAGTHGSFADAGTHGSFADAGTHRARADGSATASGDGASHGDARTSPGGRVPITFATSVRSGPVFGGNFGGAYMQNGWHALTKSGPTIEQGLADDYPSSRSLGFMLGTRARAAIGDRVQAYSFVDGQLALGGTGVSAFEAALGGNAATKYLGAHVEVAVTRYHVDDPHLALPGAFRPGFQLEWRVGVDVHWSRFRIGYEYRANESGSGEPMGVLEFSSKR